MFFDFGTAAYRVDIGAINARIAWFPPVAIVLGHIISVFIEHLISLRRVPRHKFALRDQYQMLVVMVLCTVASL